MRKLLLSACFICMFAPLMHGQTKPRIAVMDFDYATVRTASAALFGTDIDIGKGIAALLVDKLVNGGTFSVIERKALDTLMKEQNMTNSDRFDSGSAALIGRLLGVNAIVIGSITQFSVEDKSVRIGPLRIQNAEAKVGITARIINVDTAEILFSATGEGVKNRKGVGADLRFLVDLKGSEKIDMTKKDFKESIIGETVNDAVDSVASQFNANSFKVPERVVKIEGRVDDVYGNELTFDVGKEAGVKIGDILAVVRVTREVRNSDGIVTRRIEEKLGDVEITEVETGYSVGQYSGSSPVEVGDQVHN